MANRAIGPDVIRPRSLIRAWRAFDHLDVVSSKWSGHSVDVDVETMRRDDPPVNDGVLVGVAERHELVSPS